MPQHAEGDVATPVVVSDERLDSLSGQWLASRYQLGELHAHGALCVVYDAQDVVLQRPVAIKVAPVELADAYRAALDATAGLSYPAFLAVYDVIEQDERFYLVQEFIAGRPLTHYLAAGAPARRGVALALQLAQAVAYAHQHDQAHGDLTPSAILMDRNAVAHINNMRLPPDWEYFTASVNAVAQSGFAPSGAETLDALRADERLRDVWSVAFALWSLVTRGTDAPEASDDGATRVFREDVTPEIQTVIARALNLSHEQPIVSADALALALEALDEALTRDASDHHMAAPLAVRAYREERTVGAAGYGGGVTGLRRLVERHESHYPDAPTYAGASDAQVIDTSETRPADDARYAAPPAYQPRAYGGHDGYGAPAGRFASEERMGPQGANLDANPAWPRFTEGGAASDDRLMRPWVWTLIGIALFVAFFLVGYLAFPQFKLF